MSVVAADHAAPAPDAAPRASRTGAFVLAGALGGAANIVLTWALLRVLGAPGYTTIGLTLSGGVFVAALMFEWLRIYTFRHFAEHERYGAIYALYGAGIVVLAALAAGLSILNLDLGPGVSIALIAAVAAAQAVGDFLIVAGRGLQNAALVLAVQGGRGVAALIACIAVALATHDATFVLLAYALSSAAVSATVIALFRARLPRAVRYTGADIAAIARFSAPLMLSALINSLLLMSDRWVLSFTQHPGGAEALGLYIGVSDIFIRALSFFAALLVGAYFQEIAHLHDQNDAAAAKARYAALASYFWCIAAPILVGATYFHDLVGALLAPPGAAAPSGILIGAIVLAVTLHMARNSLFETLLILERKTVTVLAINIACLAAALGAGLVLLPTLGMLAIPVSYAAAALLCGAITLALLPSRVRGFIALGAQAKPLVAAVFALAPCLAMRMFAPNVGVWPVALVFACAYCGAALALGCVPVRRASIVS